METVVCEACHGEHTKVEHLRLASRARWYSILALIVIFTESLGGISAGLLASSIALIGFGLQSLAEAGGSILVLWRFSGERQHSHHAEKVSARILAFVFWGFATYIGVEALHTLLGHHIADPTWFGGSVAVFSMLAMPILGYLQRKNAALLHSHTTAQVGKQNYLCAILAASVLLGILANAVWGIWQLDPIVALGVAAASVWFGFQSWQGHVDACC